MIDVRSYVVTDSFFGAPFIDLDEVRDTPIPHRHVHGGFEGTDTRFRFYFPDPEHGYQGRMFTPLSGAHGGTEDFFGTPLGEMIGGPTMCARLGGYLVESNQGHIGDDIDPRGGGDPTLYGHRASAETARFSKFVAAQVYGTAPHHSYVFGGSGGGRRSPLCLENRPDVWDGALPFMGGGDVAEHGNTNLIKGAQVMSFASMFNVQRILGAKVADVIDAMAAGGSGDPYAGLDTHQREELASLYRQGYPRGDEFMIAEPMGQIWLWSSIADPLVEQDPTYFDRFWTEPGYVGHDFPHLVSGDLIDTTLTVTGVFSAKDIVSDSRFDGPTWSRLRATASMGISVGAPDLPVAIEVPGIGDGYRLGTGVRVASGKAAGRQLYCTSFAGDVLSCDGNGEANLLRFTDVLPGDQVHVDNHRFLAFCYFARHHIMADTQFDSLRLDGLPIHPQHPLPVMSPLMGVSYSGHFEGKLLWVHHTHDASLWPPQGIIYEGAVRAAQGAAGADERFRLRWTENAEHIPASMIPPSPQRAASTWLVDYSPIIEQSLADLVSWVEDGTVPADTRYTYRDGRVSLPAGAAERGGIQPVVSATANGSDRAEVRVGEEVVLSADAEVPSGAGTIVAVEWDFDGSGAFPYRHDDVDGTATAVSVSTTHTYDHAGTYFATARVFSHRDGDLDATARRIPNLAQVRVVVS
jgi:hypothetical protein